MPGSGVSTRPRVDTFLILSSIKLPLTVGVAVGVAVEVAVSYCVHHQANQGRKLSRPYCSFFKARKYCVFTIGSENWQWCVAPFARYRHIMVGETGHYFCFGLQHCFRILFADFAIKYCTGSDLRVIPPTQYFADSASDTP
ncbi:hypothetical protein [Massilia sp. GCM10023247]|uniref:hypothetical protein n=1 Tax=Massilia sp. GCM10023247 TaxID=3252643 RepID=UPI0036D219F2